MNFLNVYCNRIYIQNKNYSLSALLLLHTNFEKNKILLVKNVYSISPNNALFIHFYFFSLYNRTSYYFFSLDFLFIVVLLSSFSLCFSCILVSIFYTFDVSLCFIFFSWLCKKIQGTFYTLEKILLFFSFKKNPQKNNTIKSNCCVIFTRSSTCVYCHIKK